MKMFALKILLGLCIAQALAVAGYWQDQVKLSHWSNINNIINSELSEVQASARSARRPVQNCVSDATKALRAASETARLDIWSCVDNATDKAAGDSCASAVEEKTRETAKAATKAAKDCIAKV